MATVEDTSKRIYVISSLKSFLKRDDNLSKKKHKKIWRKRANYYLFSFLTTQEYKGYLISMNYYKMPKRILKIKTESKFRRAIKDYR